MITDTKWTQHSLETPVLFPYCFFPTSLRAFKPTSVLRLSVFTSVCDSAVRPTIQVQSLQVILQSSLHLTSAARPAVKSPNTVFSVSAATTLYRAITSSCLDNSRSVPWFHLCPATVYSPLSSQDEFLKRRIHVTLILQVIFHGFLSHRESDPCFLSGATGCHMTFSPPLSLLFPYPSHYSHIHPASVLLGSSFFTVGLSDRNLPICLNVSFHLGPVSPWRKPPFSFLMWVSCYQYFRVKWSEGGQGSLPVVGMNLYLTSALSGAPWFRSSQALLLWRVHIQSFWGRWRGQ